MKTLKRRIVGQRRLANRHSSFIIHHSSFSSPSFTLIEVMVVISIIAILAAFLYPAVMAARERARKKQAMAGVRNIMLAIKAYRTEYDQWPNQTQAAGDTTYVTNNFRIIQPLTGNNPREKIFLSIQTNALDRTGNYADPWGVPYLICMDENADTRLSINFNFRYTNEFMAPPEAKTYVCTNYFVETTEAGVASFGDGTNISICSWDEIE